MLIQPQSDGHPLCINVSGEDRGAEVLEVLMFWNIKQIHHIWTKTDWYMDLYILTICRALDLCWKMLGNLKNNYHGIS